MRRRLLESWAVGAALGLILLGSAAPVQAQPAGELVEIPADIPLGLASEDDQTSRGVRAILERCAAAYQAINSFHADVEYISIEKQDGETTHSTAKIQMDYVRPNKMAVHWISEDPTMRSDFVSDGTAVSMAWADEGNGKPDRKFFRMQAPDSVEAFTAVRRRGEIFDDRSNSLGPLVFVPALLSFAHPAEVFWGERKHDFAYEGLEKLGDADCYRLNVKQKNVYYSNVLWIDAKTFLVRKTSAVGNYDEDYEPVDSFDEATNAYMRIVQYDQLSTGAKAVKKDVFKWKTPRDYKRQPARSEGQSGGRRSASTGSLWDSLVAAAAQADENRSTWTLKQEPGDVELALSAVVQFEQQPLQLVGSRLPGEKEDSLFVAFKDGTISVRDYAGKEKKQVKLGGEIALFDCLENAAGEAVQLLALDKDRVFLTAYSLEGKKLWHYAHPDTTIVQMAGAAKVPEVYLTLNDGQGIRKLNSKGEIVWARSTAGYVSSVSVSSPSQNRIALSRSYSTQFFDKDLSYIFTESEDRLVSYNWEGDPEEPDLLAMVRTEDMSLLVQRRTEAGLVKWTTTLAPKLEQATSGGAMSVKLRVRGAAENTPKNLLFAGASPGVFMVVDKENGKVLTRGTLTADAATMERNGKAIIGAIGRADLNGDGASEIYIRLDKQLLRLE